MATCFRLEGVFDRLVFQRPPAIAALAWPMPTPCSQYQESNR